MSTPSGILKVHVDKNDSAVTMHLLVIDQHTGQALDDPNFPGNPAPVISADVTNGQVVIVKRDDEGRTVVDTDKGEVVRQTITGLQISLEWMDGTPQPIINKYSNQSLPERDTVRTRHGHSDTDPGRDNG